MYIFFNFTQYYNLKIDYYNYNHNIPEDGTTTEVILFILKTLLWMNYLILYTKIIYQL